MTNKLKKVKFDFYQVMAVNEENEFNFNLLELAEWIKKELPTIKKRLRNIDGEVIYLNNLPKDEQFQYFHLVRRRIDAPAIGQDNNDKLEDIILKEDQYIVEDLSMLFDSEHSILMIQRNRDSVGPTRISKYFNELYKVLKQDYAIEFRPIVRNDVFKSLKNKEVITKIDLKTADINNTNLPNTFKSLISDAVPGGIELELTMSVGRKRNKSIPKDFADDIIDSLQESNNNLQHAYVSAGNKSDNGTTFDVEAFDLISGRMIGEHIFDLGNRHSGNHLHAPSVQEEMKSIYNSQKEKIINCIKNHTD